MQAAWILDFPLVTYNEEEKRWDAEHHPFCYPVKEDVPYLESDPGRVRAQSYDLVVNGYEAASGSVRIHDATTQQKVFSLLGIAPEEAERRFGFLLEALRTVPRRTRGSLWGSTAGSCCFAVMRISAK